LTFRFSYLLEKNFSLSSTTPTKGVHHLFQAPLDGSGIASKPFFVETIPDLKNDI